MTTTLDALLSREIPIVIAENLVAAKQTLVSLSRKSDAELTALGLSEKHIDAIRDVKRPPIPPAVLRQVLDEAWRICCVCHRSGKPIVVHHIVEWGKGGTHDEENLAVLCLDDHDEAHLKGGLSLRLSADGVRDAKRKWIVRARKICDTHEAKLCSAHHRSVRWYWIHVENLRMKMASLPELSVSLSEEFLRELRDKKFIDSKGNINPDSVWIEQLAKPRKSFLFDSGDAQLMAMYVSDLLGRLIANSAFLDITDMLHEKESLLAYLSAGSIVYFRHELEIQDTKPLIKAAINKTDVRLELSFDPWTALNQTAQGIHLVTDMAERSVVGQISSIKTVGQQLRIVVSPLGISPDFVLHDSVQGAWVKGLNNDDYWARRKKARD